MQKIRSRLDTYRNRPELLRQLDMHELADLRAEAMCGGDVDLAKKISRQMEVLGD